MKQWQPVTTVLACLALLTACQGTAPYAASDTQALDSEGEPASPVLREDGRLDLELDASEQAAAHRAMREAFGDQPARPVPPAPEAPRWADVEQAVFYACREQEIGILRTVRTPADDPRELRFTLESVEGWPAELVAPRLRPAESRLI